MVRNLLAHLPLRFSSFAIASVIALCTNAAAANLQIVPSTTHTAETSNNTSAPDAINATTRGYAVSGNMSKLPIKSLLYSGATPKIYAALMGWFGKSGHISVGYNSQDPAQVKKQVEDMQSRGIDGAIEAWYGQGSYEDVTAQQLKAQAEAHQNFSFILMIDQGAIQWYSHGLAPTDALIAHLNYMAQNYYSSPAYAKINGRPIVLEFDLEAWPIDWTRVMASIQGNPVFFFRNPPAFTNVNAFGGYSWGPASGLAYTDYFNKIAEQNPSKMAMADGWKGFNDVLASWTQNRVVDQQCGQTWLASMAELSKYYSATNQLPYLQIPTWNDYEEGTTIESGIDNCVTVNATTSGTSLQWQLSGAGLENTIDHYTAFISTDGENLMSLGDVPTGTYSLDLSQFNLAGGNYTLYVKAVGKASLKNQMSNAVTFTKTSSVPVATLSLTPNSGYTPTTVSASAAGSSESGGAIASTQIDFGDGTVVPAVTANHQYANAGTYTVTATVTDTLGTKASTSSTVTVAPAAVTITLPSTQPNAATPLHVVASAVSGRPITGMWVYLDNVGIYGNHASSLDIYLTVTTGTHVLQVKAWDNTGHIISSSVTLNVAAGSIAPRGSRTTSGTTTLAPRLAGSTTTVQPADNTSAALPRATRLGR